MSSNPTYYLILFLGFTSLTSTTNQAQEATAELHTAANEEAPDFTPKPVNPEVLKRLPKTHGELTGEIFIGQRTVIEKFNGWGWIKKENESWKKAKWAFIKEIPHRYKVPHRFLGDEDADTGIRYKLYGRFADYEGYEANYDLFTHVFILRGWEVIGVGDDIGKHLPGKVIIRKQKSTPFTRRKPTVTREEH